MDMYWPGPTRLYDPDVEAGAVLLTKEQALALVVAAEGGLRECGYETNVKRRVKTAIRTICWVFDIPEGEDE